MYREILLQRKMKLYRLKKTKFLRNEYLTKHLQKDLDCLDFYIWSTFHVFTCTNVKKHNIERLSHLFFDSEQTYQCYNTGHIVKFDKTNQRASAPLIVPIPVGLSTPVALTTPVGLIKAKASVRSDTTHQNIKEPLMNTNIQFPMQDAHQKNLSFTICRYQEAKYLKTLIKFFNGRFSFAKR
jgi:hypothetical protein